MKKKTSVPVSTVNATWLKQEGVTVRGQQVIAASGKKVRLADGRVFLKKGERAVYTIGQVDNSILSQDSGDTERDSL